MPSSLTSGPALIVTGAAAAGKSTVGGALAARHGVLALDGDVLAGGAAAVAGGRRDYEAFWQFLLCLAHDVQVNGLVPIYSCICLPEQVLANSEVHAFTGIHFLALVCDEVELRERILCRQGADTSIANLDFHLDFNRRLREESVELPHSFTLLDTSGSAPGTTVERANDWVVEMLPTARR